MNNENLIKVGLIGLGAQMQCEIIPALMLSNDTFEIVAICDKEIENINLVKSFFTKANIYTDYKILLDIETKITHVIVCLPHHLYLTVIQDCLTRGLDVFKEKPLALNFQESRNICKTATIKNKILYTVTKRDFYHTYTTGKTLLDRLGVIYQYTAKHYVTGGNLHEGWKSNKELAGGGALINLGYHMLSVLIEYFGDITDAVIYSSNKGKEGYVYDIEDAGTAIISHKDGIYGSFQFNCYTGIKEESLEIHGTKGSMIITKTYIKIFDIDGTETFNEVFTNDGTNAVVQALYAFINKEDSSLNNSQRNLKVMESIQKMYQNNKFSLK